MDKNIRLGVQGFTFNGIHVGIKEGQKKDLSLIHSQVPAVASAVFTTNDFKAAPVLLSMERIREGVAQTIITNSGNANAATGEQGYRDAVTMSHVTAVEIGVDPSSVLVASTGKIGEFLPIKKIETGIPSLIRGLSAEKIDAAEEAIMTTDKFPKLERRTGRIGSQEVTICGIAKGAGMIEPNMATMLAYVMTDAQIVHKELDKVFRESVDRSFNAISVDGCMSTNDMAVVMANGFAGNKTLNSGTGDYHIFSEMLFSVMEELAKSIVRDGEGATKVLEIVVVGANTQDNAKKVAYAIARSNLVKTAFFGKDPNWGRIISAAGSVGLGISNDQMEVLLDDFPVFSSGRGCKGAESRLLDIMEQNNIRVTVNLGMGKESFKMFASDLSHEYVHINADYHT